MVLNPCYNRTITVALQPIWKIQNKGENRKISKVDSIKVHHEMDLLGWKVKIVRLDDILYNREKNDLLNLDF